MPDQPSPRRRFQFRLRALMIVVTLFCLLVGDGASRAKIVPERQAMRDWIESHHGTVYDTFGNAPRLTVPWLRGVLGDRPVQFVLMHNARPTHDEARRILATFEEL